MLKTIEIDGIKGPVLVKVFHTHDNTFEKLKSVKSPATGENFLFEDGHIEIPLNDFHHESCYGDMTFFADEINSALTDGAELLWVEEV